MEADLQGMNSHPTPTQRGVKTRLQALQLLEYLIKNGSERTVDDARSHIGTIKMLRNFHYIDDKGKDQGINGRSGGPMPRSMAEAPSSPQPCQGDCRTPKRP